MLSRLRFFFVIFATILAWATAAPVLARDGSAGSIVATTPLAGAPDGAAAYRIHYRSADTRGQSVVVTAAVLVPRGRAPAFGRDVVVWAHGASGVAENCGLSDKPGLYDQVAGLRALLAAGYVVVAPDYEGLGNPGPHPFLVGIASAHSVIDAVRAARAMPTTRASSRYALFGESLGGFSVLWAASEASRYAPELQLVGVAAAAPPTDLKANLTGGTNAAVRAFLTAYTASSWEKIYAVPLTTVVRPRTAALIRALAKNCVTLDGFKLRTKIGMLRLAGQLKNVDLGATPRWAALMRQNSVDPSRLNVPIFVAQGSADAIVAPQVTRAFVQKLCSRERKVQFMAIEGGDHVSVGKRSADVVVEWIGKRFAGEPAPSNCGKN